MVTVLRRADAGEGAQAVPELCHPSWELAARFDRALGDPGDPATVFSYQEAVRLDDAEEFPDEACAALDAWGLADYYVPAGYGGKLTGFEDLQQLIRMLARRDLTVAVGHGKTFLGSVSVWASGDHAAAVRLGALVRAGARVSLGLTERTHGSDIMAGELTAEPVGPGYRVNGEKWLINNATRGRLLSLLARTSPVGGPRGFTLLLLDKEELPQETYRCLPKVPTHGIRGADISGVVIQDAVVGPEAVVGGAGGGAELLLKSLQLTRTLCPSLSLGAADHALRLAVEFAHERVLYGRQLTELPLTRRTLAEAYADLLVCEALSTVATRSIHALPSELSVTSAVAKYLVPTIIDGQVSALGSLLGARSFLSGEFAHGSFQKVARDHRIVGIFDGNTLVNQYSLVAQFRSLARNYLGPLDHRPRLGTLFNLSRSLPPFDPERLNLLSRYGSSILGTLPVSVTRLADAALLNPALGGAAQCAAELRAEADALHRRIARRMETVAAASPESFNDARKYGLCFTGAACLGLWLHSHREAEAGGTGGLWQDGLWLEAVLNRLLGRLEVRAPAGVAEDPLFERLYTQLTQQYQDGSLFSLLPCPIAEGPPSC
ncbi:acyl-CoA dehydrogenase family protein [Streptomyces sp. H10-C2]|uniref:acyl-CoA dehydrogenase family protein n=1 Tax=unclassified Streptomyces TaxID=2593676 RepID=UPI0024B90600|nr:MULTISPECIES: acyl-CoA dehydrogenase family protein [unclassified Streptomyces]MDJ0341811.1 acyl-CoA dehydrogenase family protein [Streptomyces sp. PH10-H1]MDJ0370435.1 acyl-CoA dehydrogenase family protein [Streptomyces sp. H10-C2]